jgi:hypothetical protein
MKLLVIISMDKYSGCKITLSTSCVTVRGREGKGKGEQESKESV